MQFYLNCKNIIMDFDGTIVDSSGDIVSQLYNTYAEILPQKKIMVHKKHIGPPLPQMINMISPGLSEEIVKQLVLAFRERYALCGFPQTSLYSGVKELLEYISIMGGKWFIATNKPLHLTKIIIEKLRITGYESIITPDSTNLKNLNKSEMIKEVIKMNNLDSQETVVIGDMESDVCAAKENCCISIAFSGGYGEFNKLVNAEPTYIVKDISEIKNILRIVQEDK